jgi:hypothetical protein
MTPGDRARSGEETLAAPQWPNGKRFAFTIIDDTDGATVGNVGAVYDLLYDRGILTTKTVWPLSFRRSPRYGGGTLEDPEYRAWVLDLQEKGFEIASHGATDHSSPRGDTEKALDHFREVLGSNPRIHVNHRGQAESMYWGDMRVDGLSRVAYRAVHAALRRDAQYFGHVEDSEYFWGDLCYDRITYVRNYTFSDVNTLKKSPLMPYHDSRRPYVRYWFSASEAPAGDDFCRLLDEANQDRLVAEGGACLVYTHFAYGFSEDGRLDRRFEELVTRLSELPGWFVPASTLLDFLRRRSGWREAPGSAELSKMQRRWLLHKLRRGRQ